LDLKSNIMARRFSVAITEDSAGFAAKYLDLKGASAPFDSRSDVKIPRTTSPFSINRPPNSRRSQSRAMGVISQRLSFAHTTRGSKTYRRRWTASPRSSRPALDLSGFVMDDDGEGDKTPGRKAAGASA